MSRSIEQMVDILFQQKDGAHWKWPAFMRKIVGMKQTPKRTTPQTLKWIKYVQYRPTVVAAMNKEIEKRKDCRFLTVVPSKRKGETQTVGGVLWLDPITATPFIISQRLSKQMRMISKQTGWCDRLIHAKNTPKKHKTIAQRQRRNALSSGTQKVSSVIEDMNIKLLPAGLDESI